MSYFAKVVDGKVINVIVAEPEFFDTFIDSIPGDWIQTSYNVRGGVYYEPGSNLTIPVADQASAMAGHPERQRKNTAATGMLYDRKLDIFYYPKPYASWVLNESTGTWEAPTAMPPLSESPCGEWQWEESTKEWVARTAMPV